MTTVAEVKSQLVQYNGVLVQDEKFVGPGDATKDNKPYYHVQIPGQPVMLFATLEEVIPFMVKNNIPKKAGTPDVPPPGNPNDRGKFPSNDV